MAEESKPIKRKKLPSGVRIFREPLVKIVRMGREAVIFNAAYGKLDLKRGRIELFEARVEVPPVALTSDQLGLDLIKNRITAKGQVKIDEQGVSLEGRELTAQPTLTGLQFKGDVRLHADNQEAADALLKSGLR